MSPFDPTTPRDPAEAARIAVVARLARVRPHVVLPPPTPPARLAVTALGGLGPAVAAAAFLRDLDRSAPWIETLLLVGDAARGLAAATGLRAREVVRERGAVGGATAALRLRLFAPDTYVDLSPAWAAEPVFARLSRARLTLGAGPEARTGTDYDAVVPTPRDGDTARRDAVLRLLLALPDAPPPAPAPAPGTGGIVVDPVLGDGIGLPLDRAVFAALALVRRGATRVAVVMPSGAAVPPLPPERRDRVACVRADALDARVSLYAAAVGVVAVDPAHTALARLVGARAALVEGPFAARPHEAAVGRAFPCSPCDEAGRPAPRFCDGRYDCLRAVTADDIAAVAAPWLPPRLTESPSI